MGMTCGNCGAWSETIYNTSDPPPEYCPMCGVHLDDVESEWDDEEEADADPKDP